MYTLIFMTFGLTYEAKGIVFVNAETYPWVKCDVIGLGEEWINLDHALALRYLNQKEYEDYKKIMKDLIDEELRKKFAAGKGFN